MSLIKRLSFGYQSAVDWPTCWQLWWYTMHFSAAIRWPWLYRRLWQNQESKCYQIFWNDKQFKLFMRPQDIPIFYEIFQDEAYRLPPGVKIPVQANVLDIGSHIGLFSYCFYLQYSTSMQITALEPDPNNFALLKTNLGRNSNISLYQKAVATKNRTAFLQTNGLSYNHRLGTQEDGVEVATISILDLLEPYSDSEKLFLLKMDVEGLEAQLVPLLRSKISILQYLLIEIHPPYTSDQLKKDLSISVSQLHHMEASTYFINFAGEQHKNR